MQVRVTTENVLFQFASDVSYTPIYEHNSQLRKQKRAEARAQNQQQEYNSALLAQDSYNHRKHIDFESPVDLNVMQILAETQYWRKPLTNGAFAIRNRDDLESSFAGGKCKRVGRSFVL